jgi:hypothetical protein
LLPRQLRAAALTQRWRSSCVALVLYGLGACACSQDDGLGLAAKAAQPVTEGTPTSANPEVVALLAGERVICSGVFVRPSVALTAAHCLSGAAPDALLASIDGREERMGIAGSWPHPQHLIGRTQFDIAVLRSDRALAAPSASVGGAAPEIGSEVRVVGFGRTIADDPASGGKREGMALVESVSAATLTLAASPALPCAGDSGAPIFASVDGVERVIGIVSSGDELCADYSDVVRIDAQWDTFVAPLIEHIEATAEPIGAPCLSDGNCESGICLTPADAPSFPYCSRPCADGDGCPEGLECRESEGDLARCLFPPPSPGALGAPCNGDDDCELGLCVAFDEDAPRVCSALCFSSADECPAATECQPSTARHPDGKSIWGCAPGRDVNDFAPRGGCTVAGAAGRAEASFIAFVLALGLLRCRRAVAAWGPGKLRFRS